MCVCVCVCVCVYMDLNGVGYDEGSLFLTLY